MGRTCTVCAHPESFEVNTALIVEKRSNRNVAKQFGLDYQAIYRHREHIPDLLLKGSQALEVFEADSLLEDIARIRESALDLLNKAEQAHDWRARIASIRECRENVRVLGELQGRLEASRQNININLVANPQWLELKGVIITALREHPGALEAVSQAIRGRELTNGS